MRRRCARVLGRVNACRSGEQKGRRTYGAVHGARGNVLASRVKPGCEDFARMACQLHYWRLQCAGARALDCPSAPSLAQCCPCAGARTYHLDESAILPRPICDGDGSARAQTRVRLCAFNQLRGAERVGGGPLFSRHDGRGAVWGGLVGCAVVGTVGSG